MNILPEVEEAMRLHRNDSRPGSGNRKKRGKCFSAPKLQNSGVATGPGDYAECFVCNSDFDAIISPP
jgi:hypothetical protein